MVLSPKQSRCPTSPGPCCVLPGGGAAWAGVCLQGAARPLHRPGAQPGGLPPAALLDPSAPALSLNWAPIPPIRNAAKYGQGKPIDVSIEGNEGEYLIRVRDRGIGIAPEDQERIFERFERAVSERHYGGLGLGLWISRRIASRLGGTLTVWSRPGEGSTFELRLPRFPSESRPTEPVDEAHW
jgi:hypothetical protein